MTAREALRDALLTTSRTVLQASAMRVFDAVPVRAAVPYAVLGEPTDSDWGAAGIEGRELRVAMTLVDEGERPLQLRTAMRAVEDIALTGPLADGWTVASLAVVATRMAKAATRWTASVEWRARLWRAGQ